MSDTEALLDAVCVAVDGDGNCRDETALAALYDRLQETATPVPTVARSSLFGFQLVYCRNSDVGFCAVLLGRSNDDGWSRDGDHGCDFCKWLRQAIGLDYYLDGK